MENGFIYKNFIDPILKPMRLRVTDEINPNETVIDVACGTGAQIFELLKKGNKVIGVDFSESMIEHAQKTCKKRNLNNAEFYIGDATDLSLFYNGEIDIATISLALHQFKPELHSTILNEMRKVAKRLIIVDYAVPLPGNYAGVGCRVAEFLAGKEHNQNFKKYYQLGGLNKILPKNQFVIQKTVFFGKGAFQLVVAKNAM